MDRKLYLWGDFLWGQNFVIFVPCDIFSLHVNLHLEFDFSWTQKWDVLAELLEVVDNATILPQIGIISVEVYELVPRPAVFGDIFLWCDSQADLTLSHFGFDSDSGLSCWAEWIACGDGKVADALFISYCSVSRDSEGIHPHMLVVEERILRTSLHYLCKKRFY